MICVGYCDAAYLQACEKLTVFRLTEHLVMKDSRK